MMEEEVDLTDSSQHLVNLDAVDMTIGKITLNADRDVRRLPPPFRVDAVPSLKQCFE